MKWLNSRQSSFLLNWFLATVIGMIAGKCTPIGFESDKVFLMINLNWISAIGIFITLTQWLVLQHIVHVKWWIFFSFLGYLCAAMISGIVLETTKGASLSNELYRNTYDFLEGAIIGFCIGVIQWFSIRHVIPNSKLWIFANMLGWGFGIMIRRFWVSPFEITYIPQEFIGLFNTIESCIPIAGITGLVLLKLPNLISEKSTT